MTKSLICKLRNILQWIYFIYKVTIKVELCEILTGPGQVKKFIGYVGAKTLIIDPTRA